VVWQACWIERLRFGAKPIPPRSVVIDGYWRRDDPLPALVHYPHEVVAMIAANTSAWCGRLRPRWQELDVSGRSLTQKSSRAGCDAILIQIVFKQNRFQAKHASDWSGGHRLV
jgi:hypothetical protein